MGREITCPARVGNKSATVKALLETAEVVLRGEIKLRAPFSAMTRLTVDAGWLRFALPGTEVALKLGDDAAKWADRIKNPPSRLQKLGIKPGIEVCVIDPPETRFVRELEASGAKLRKGPRPQGADVVFLGAETRAALTRLSTLGHAIARNGAIWILRPKGSAKITEAETRAAGLAAGLVDVKVVAFSQTHTAEKFVIPVAKR